MEWELQISPILDLNSTLSLKAEQLVRMALSSQELITTLMAHSPNPKLIWTRVGSLQLQMWCWIIQDTQTGVIKLFTKMIQTQVRATLIKTLRKVQMVRSVLLPATWSSVLRQIATILQGLQPSSIRILNQLCQEKMSRKHSRTRSTSVVLSTKSTIRI